MDNIDEIIRYATLAPSGHNTQPWKFYLEKNQIKIFPDYSRRLPAVDPDDRELFISLGCALENLVIAAEHNGYSTNVEYFFDGNGEDFISVVLGTDGIKKDDTLYDAIPQRQTTRSKYDGNPLHDDDFDKLKSVVMEDGISSLFITDDDKIEAIIDLVRKGNNIQMNDEKFKNELTSWIRFNDSDTKKHLDGLSSKSMGSPSIPSWFGRLFIKYFATDKAQSKKDEINIRNSSSLLVIMSDDNNKTAWVDTGRSFERLVLNATALNIKNAHLNQPCEIPQLREKLQDILSIDSRHPQLLLRVGYGQTLPRSQRRHVEDVVY